MSLQVRGGGVPALTPVLEAQDLGKRRGAAWVLRGVSLRLAPGQRLVVVGPNGAGKTTLLRVLAGLARRDAGALRLLGRPWDGRDPALRRQVGYLAHEPLLLPELTARENLLWLAGAYGLSAASADAWLARVGLGGRAHVPVRHLSRGQRQRLALARVLLPRPRLLLLDEPWTGLDADARRLLETWLQEHEAAGGATVLTSHEPPPGAPILRLERGRPVT